MANSITLSPVLSKNLDEVYAASLLTIDLVGNNEDVASTNNPNQIAIPKVSLKGLKAYNRGTGYSTNDITITTETVTCNYDRGAKMIIDACDEQECNVKAAKLLSELERTKAAADKDTFTFSTLAAAGTTPVAAALADAAAYVAAIRAGVDAMDNAEVTGEKILYITPSALGLIRDADTTKSREVLAEFSKIVKVPQSRFFTGATADATNGGYTTGSSSKNIQFMIVEKSAVINYEKRTVGDIITPEANPDADGYILKYRKVAYVDVYENKVAGVYTHTVA